MTVASRAEAPSHLRVRLLRLPTRATLTAAHNVAGDTASVRELVIVELHEPGDESAGRGWGECSALNTAGYTNEWAAGSYAVLAGAAPIDASTHPMASAAIEMALLDWELRQANQSLGERLGTVGSSATAGAVVGLNTIPAMLGQVHELVAAGYTRVKCKVLPGRLTEPLRAIAAEVDGVELMIDANGSLGADDLAALSSLRDLGVGAVEQPFAVGDHATAQRLVAESDLHVIADEAVNDDADMWELAQDQAATAVAIKPPRIAGIAATLQLLDQVALAGMGATIGGMLESGLGRHVLAALAPLDSFTITGDLSPAGRWLASDPFDDLTMVDGQIVVPDVPGIAGDPDPELLDRFTIDEALVRVPRSTD